MKKLRTALIVLSAIYIVLTVIALLNNEALFNSFNLLKLIDYLQWWIVVGLVLLSAIIIVGSLYIQSLNRRHRKLEKEYTSIKARLFDIEEERKAEVAARRAEEETTEQKLEAFNKSLKDKENPPAEGDQPPRKTE